MRCAVEAEAGLFRVEVEQCSCHGMMRCVQADQMDQKDQTVQKVQTVQTVQTVSRR